MSPDAPASILRVEHLTKRFGNITAVDDISLQIYPDEKTAIIGPNGAGKTTFTDLVSGSLPSTRGTIRFDQEDVTDLSEYQRARRGLVRSFQSPQLFEGLSVLENVLMGITTRHRRNGQFTTPVAWTHGLEAEAASVLARFGLSEHEHASVASLPYGVQKVLDIAITFVLDPALALFDEPTSGVSSTDKHGIMRLVTDSVANSDVALVFIEHDMELVREYADRVVALHNGRILNDGDPEDVLTSDVVVEAIREQGV